MEAIRQLELNYRKPALPQVQTGDTVRVHQLIKEGAKQRIQVFEGIIIRTHRMNELTACVTVRRIASGIGVEKTFLLHSPNVSKIEILRRAKVRRNFLSFLRERRGKSARLREISFDKIAANDVSTPETPAGDTDETEVIDAEQAEDALTDAVPLADVEKSEAKAAASEDEPNTAADTGTPDEQQAPADEAEAGVAQAEPGEGKAVQS
ncbi:MAG TPA: 50S ribosomal protein L19 [Candidatus Saccharimonadia bacterium]|nr:50S ribosomal protein L19 [Candidatus Saccharimonadia bacterium]